MNNGDYIKLYRSLLDWEWFKSPNTSHVWIYILLNANWEVGRHQGIEIPKGSFVRTLENMSKETGLSISQVRTALKHLKKSGEISINLAGKSQLITIEKWGSFQVAYSKVNNVLADKSQVNDTDIRNKEIKNIRNNKEKETNKEKERLGFTKPSVCEVEDFIKEKGYHFDASSFVAYYDSNGWKVGRNPMKSWKSACVTWESRYKPKEEFF